MFRYKFTRLIEVLRFEAGMHSPLKRHPAAQPNPEVSIIMPSFNTAKYIRQSINSIRRFTFENFELLIIDDASSDATVRIANSIAKIDARIKVFPQKHNGVSAARNFGIKQAKGKFILFLDSDDLFNPAALADMVESLNASNSSLCAAKYMRYVNNRCAEPAYWIQDIYAQNQTKISLEKFTKILAHSIIHGKLINRDFFMSHDFSFPLNTLYEDQLLSAKLYLEADGIDTLIEPLVYWRERREQNSITQIWTAEHVHFYLDQIKLTLDYLANAGKMLRDQRAAQYLSYDIPNMLRGTNEMPHLQNLVIPIALEMLDSLSPSLVDEIPPAAHSAYDLLRDSKIDSFRKYTGDTQLQSVNIEYANQNGWAVSNDGFKLPKIAAPAVSFIRGSGDSKKGWAFLLNIDPAKFPYKFQAYSDGKEIPITPSPSNSIRQIYRNFPIDYSACGFKITGAPDTIKISAGKYSAEVRL